MIKRQTLQTLFFEYIRRREYVANLRPATLKGYKEAFKTFEKIMPEIVYPFHLNEDKMVNFFEKIKNRKRIVGKNTEKIGVRVSTIQTYWCKINLFFNWLVEHGHIQSNPLSKIRPPHPTYTDVKELPKSSIEKIVGAIILQSTNLLLQKRDMAMVQVFLYCGLRKGELISLKVSDLDLFNSKISIRGETSKSKRTKILPLHPCVVNSLKDYISERNIEDYKTEYLWVSGNNDKGLSVHGFKHWIERLNILSGVKFHAHRFRHTFACNLAKNDVSPLKIQKLMGHADFKMTQVYLRSIKSEELVGDVLRLEY